MYGKNSLGQRVSLLNTTFFVCKTSSYSAPANPLYTSECMYNKQQLRAQVHDRKFVAMQGVLESIYATEWWPGSVLYRTRDSCFGRQTEQSNPIIARGFHAQVWQSPWSRDTQATTTLLHYAPFAPASAVIAIVLVFVVRWLLKVKAIPHALRSLRKAILW